MEQSEWLVIIEMAREAQYDKKSTENDCREYVSGSS